MANVSIKKLGAALDKAEAECMFAVLKYPRIGNAGRREPEQKFLAAKRAYRAAAFAVVAAKGVRFKYGDWDELQAELEATQCRLEELAETDSTARQWIDAQAARQLAEDRDDVNETNRAWDNKFGRRRRADPDGNIPTGRSKTIDGLRYPVMEH